MRPQDIHEKLCDLALWYLIRAEAANLRFCPEYVRTYTHARVVLRATVRTHMVHAALLPLHACRLLCWLHHQMKAPANYMPPRPSLMEANLQKSLNEATTGSATGPRHSVADIEGMLRELQTAQAAGDDMGFFFSATVQPLYDMMKRASVKDEPATVCAHLPLRRVRVHGCITCLHVVL
ncbi:hypothetical protein EON62_01095 [archaeon]|nr:MAG: hypothetical protein EON62_01095 [archaeon]